MIDFIKNSKSDLIFSNFTCNVGSLIDRHQCFIDQLKREVAFVILPQHELALKLYLLTMASKLVPLFLHDKIAPKALMHLLDRFKPAKLITSDQYKNAIPGYKMSYFGDGYVVLEARRVIDYKIDDDLCLLVSTSGSTGSPKLIPQTFSNLITNTEQIIRALNISGDNVAIASLPLSYTFGMSVVNSQLLKHGIILASNFNLCDKLTLQSILEHNVTTLAGVPTHYEQLVQFKFFESKYSQSIRNFLQAGGRLKTNTYKTIRTHQIRRNFNFYRMYGQAEATTRITTSSPEMPDIDCVGVGKPIKGIDLFIDEAVSSTTKLVCGGEICLRGANVCPDYVFAFEDLAKLKERKHNILRTGDLGYIDDYGELFITGRIKRFAKIRGISYNLDEIENYIFSETGIVTPCLESGDRVHVFYPLDESSLAHQTLDDIFNEIDLLDRNFHFSVDIPLLSNGKVSYSELEKKLILVGRYS